MKILIDTDWFSAIQDLQPSKQKEVLMAILNYPNGDSDTNLWKKTILPNLEKGKISYFNRLQNLKQNNPQKSNKKNTESVSESVIGSVSESDTDTTIRQDKIREDKDKTKNKFNINSIIYVNGQYFDEFPPESIPTIKKYWTDETIERIRKDIAFKPDHETTVAQLLLQYPSDQVDIDAEFEKFWTNYIPVATTSGCVQKGSKKDAKIKYTKAVKLGAKPEDIYKGMIAYLQDCQKNNRFSCGATVFLNQERWKDEYNTPVIIAQQPKPMTARERQDMENKLKTEALLRKLEEQGN